MSIKKQITTQNAYPLLMTWEKVEGYRSQYYCFRDTEDIKINKLKFLVEQYGSIYLKIELNETEIDSFATYA